MTDLRDSAERMTSSSMGSGRLPDIAVSSRATAG